MTTNNQLDSPAQKWAASRPRKGAKGFYESTMCGIQRMDFVVVSVEGEICTALYDGKVDTFLWCFHSGLNRLHHWEGKQQ